MIFLHSIESSINTFARLSNLVSTPSKSNPDPKYRKFVESILKKLEVQSKNCDVGYLWNALTEIGDKEIVNSLKTNIPFINMADSGGLQMITLGLSSDDETKKGIFERQALYSTHAMSFDEMPIRVKEQKSSKLDLTSRYFITDLLYESGYKSGNNLILQCETFHKLYTAYENDNTLPKPKSKILVILQGNSIDGYNEYARGLFDRMNELPTDVRDQYYKYIKGISLGMTGCTEFYDLIDVYCRAPIDLTHVPEQFRSFVHFLGIGGITKVSFLTALQSDFFGKDVEITFDSTSRTSSATYGKFTTFENKNKVTHALGRTYGKPVDLLIRKTLHKFGNILEDCFGPEILDPEYFRENYTPWRKCLTRKKADLIEKHGKTAETDKMHTNINYVIDFLIWANELTVFLEILDEFRSGNYGALNNVLFRTASEVLHNIKNYDEYMEKKDYFRLLLKSKRVNNVNIIKSVEEFENIDKYQGIDDEW